MCFSTETSGGADEQQESIREITGAAKSIDLRLVAHDFRRREASTLRSPSSSAKARTRCLGELSWYQRRREFVAAIARARLPAVYSSSEFADDGGLMTLAVSTDERYREAARYVDRILRGAKPADLAVEEPTRLDLVVNLEAARALGIKIPSSILVRADRVIE